jgi:hypothetical protein
MAAYSKYFEKIRIRRDRQADAETDAPRCQWDGCTEAGTHRAPVGRMREGEYFRFCLEHVRHYNKGFNYFSGIADSEIARFQKEALTGHRPTWRIGSNGGSVYASDFARLRSGTAGYYNRLRDPFGVFGGAAREDRAETPRRRKLRSASSPTWWCPPIRWRIHTCRTSIRTICSTADDLAILAGFAYNRRVMVSGYHGTGKSTHIEQVAARLNWPCVRINLDSHVSRIDLVGKDAIVIKDGSRSPNSATASCPGPISTTSRWSSTNTTPAART